MLCFPYVNPSIITGTQETDKITFMLWMREQKVSKILGSKTHSRIRSLPDYHSLHEQRDLSFWNLHRLGYPA